MTEFQYRIGLECQAGSGSCLDGHSATELVPGIGPDTRIMDIRRSAPLRTLSDCNSRLSIRILGAWLQDENGLSPYSVYARYPIGMPIRIVPE